MTDFLTEIVMAEIISEDILEWARDLAAIKRLLAGLQLQRAPEATPVILHLLPRADHNLIRNRESEIRPFPADQ